MDKDGSPALAMRRAAMNCLARRDHSFAELKQKLARKYPAPDLESLIEETLNRLREENLQSDERFVRSYIRYRKERGFGPLKISAELRRKKVDPDLLRKALYSAEHNWLEVCGNVLEKKFHAAGDKGKPTLAELRKRNLFLIQRGFSAADIRACGGGMDD